MTPLMRASFKGHAEIVEMLLAHPRVQVNIQTKVFSGCVSSVFGSVPYCIAGLKKMVDPVLVLCFSDLSTNRFHPFCITCRKETRPL